MPQFHRPDPETQREITTVCKVMIASHYYAEAEWLNQSIRRPQLCTRGVAREAMVSARFIARQFGFPRVSDWITSVLQDSNAGTAAGA